MKLNDRTNLSLRVPMVVASRRGRCTASDLTEWVGAPTDHLVRVVQTLQQHGWARTTRGRSGGIDLAVDPASLTTGEVVRKVESRFELVECFREQGRCPLAGGCSLTAALTDARDAFLAALDRSTLADLSRSSERVPLRSLREGSPAREPRLRDGGAATNERFRGVSPEIDLRRRCKFRARAMRGRMDRSA